MLTYVFQNISYVVEAESIKFSMKIGCSLFNFIHCIEFILFLCGNSVFFALQGVVTEIGTRLLPTTRTLNTDASTEGNGNWNWKNSLY